MNPSAVTDSIKIHTTVENPTNGRSLDERFHEYLR